MSAGISQATQTALLIDRRGISCVDSIFASQEAQLKFMPEGDSVFTSFYDLTCAFNTVEFCVLLQQLYIQCWYQGKVLEINEEIVQGFQ